MTAKQRAAILLRLTADMLRREDEDDGHLSEHLTIRVTPKYQKTYDHTLPDWREHLRVGYGSVSLREPMMTPSGSLHFGSPCDIEDFVVLLLQKVAEARRATRAAGR